ncbi:MAG: NAD(P)/FAD-dependent oxidoreductase [Oscillospiraceae bacterium]|nr:NAD(P)/FAD-dependent oxidoreductase [Oscillospiraceae bacterium]
MSKQYDIVVVGAGNAGMSAALHCAMEGKKVLLIEQHNLPGGCATSFVRGRFEFEPSLHELCDIGTAEDPGEIRQMMEEYGVKVDWKPVPDCFRIISQYTDGSPMDVTMPAGKEPFIDQMEVYVPGSRPKMEEYFELLEEIMAGTAYISASNGHADSKVLKEKYPNLLRTGAYPVKKVWDAIKLPKKCQDIMSTYWGYLGIDMTRMAFIHYCNMFMKYVTRAAYIPAHTSHEISNAMIERFRELGGEVWFNCRAEEFLFNGDRLCGVKTTMGTVECRYVLANINPDIIYARMMPKELIPEREKKLSTARNHNYSARMYTVYVGLNRTAEELGIQDYCIFMAGTSDSAKEYRNILGGYDSNNFTIFLCSNIANPEASPPGTAVGFFTSMGNPDEWGDLSQEDYVAYKNKYAKKFINMLKERAGIDIAPYIEEICVASPWTFARYLGTPEGSVYGYETAEWDGMMARMMMLGSDYPIKGLRPIGAAGPRGDGYSSAYVCGKLMARLALKDLREEGGEN